MKFTASFQIIGLSKKTLKLFEILIFSTLLSPCQGSPWSLEVSSWSAIYRSQSLEELMEADQKNQKNRGGLDFYKKKCLQEEKSKDFPIYCFKVLDSLLTKPQKEKQWKRLLKKNRQLCLSRASQISSINQIKTLLLQPWIGPLCRKSLENRLEDLKYIQSKEGLRVSPP